MGQVVNPVDEGDFLVVTLHGQVFAVHDQKSGEPQGTAEGLGQPGVVRQGDKLFLNLEVDLLAGEAMLAAEFPEG